VRKIVLQRWALIFLLVSRLVIGELGHAMPMTHGPSHAQEIAAAQSDSADCADHEVASAKDTAPSQECCKTGECECPCLHVPCAVLDAITVGPADLDGQPLTPGVQGLMLQRLSGLFRPPA
jgi:hypothetical protein